MTKMVPMKERVKNFYFKLFERGEDRTYGGRPVEKCLPEIYRELIDGGLFDYMIDRNGKDSITYRLFIERIGDSMGDIFEVVIKSFEEELENTKEILSDYNPRRDEKDIEPILKKYSLLSRSISKISKSYVNYHASIDNIDEFKKEFDLAQRECTNAILFERVYNAHFRFIWHDLLIALDGGLFEQLFSLVTNTLEKDGYMKWNKMEELVFIDQ